MVIYNQHWFSMVTTAVVSEVKITVEQLTSQINPRLPSDCAYRFVFIPKHKPVPQTQQGSLGVYFRATDLTNSKPWVCLENHFCELQNYKWVNYKIEHTILRTLRYQDSEPSESLSMFQEFKFSKFSKLSVISVVFYIEEKRSFLQLKLLHVISLVFFLIMH